MRKTESLPLVVGLPGTTVTDDDRALLERVRPAGVILFSRNIETPDQVRELVSGLQDLEPRPFVTADLEGGMVNRLSALWGDLPPPAEAAAAGRRAVRALGEAAGAACRNLGIQLDLAPVVDLDCPGGCLSGQRAGVSAVIPTGSSSLHEFSTRASGNGGFRAAASTSRVSGRYRPTPTKSFPFLNRTRKNSAANSKSSKSWAPIFQPSWLRTS